MSDTPETDDAQWGTGKVTTDFARRLERERDEARKQLYAAVGLLSTIPQFRDKHPEEVFKFVEETAK